MCFISGFNARRTTWENHFFCESYARVECAYLWMTFDRIRISDAFDICLGVNGRDTTDQQQSIG